MLLSSELDGILCSFEQLVVPLDLIPTGVGNDTLACIDQTLLVTAFTTGEDQ